MATTVDGTSGVSKVQDGVVVTADLADGAVTKAKLDAAALPLGVGQTWQDVTASRTYGVTYTNDTGRTIAISEWWELR